MIPVVNALTGIDANHVPITMHIARRAYDDFVALQIEWAYVQAALRGSGS